MESMMQKKPCPYSSVVERFLGKEEVTGSIPVVGSITKVTNRCRTVMEKNHV